MIDYTKLREKLIPTPDGEPNLVLRTATVDAVNADGTVDLEMSSGAIVPNVPRLVGAYAPVGAVVQVISLRGSLLVIGAVTGDNTDQMIKFQDTISILSADTTRPTGLRNWPDGFQFPAGSEVVAFANYTAVDSGLGNLPFWTARVRQHTPTQYELYAYGTGSAAGANQTMNVDVVAWSLPS